MATISPAPGGMKENRTAHPYHMYDAIRLQPSLIAGLLRTHRAEIDRAADAAAACQRLIFAGIGTSGHAAQLGGYFLRLLTAGRLTPLFEQSFELVNYPLALGPGDALIATSHRGWKNFSVEAVRRAKAAGALTIAITGEGGGEGIRAADFVFPTCEQEISFAHTKSYTTALAVLAALAIRIAEQRNLLSDAAAARAALERIPDAITSAFACEHQARTAAKAIAVRQRLIFVGAGPNSITAREAALKVKETSYVAAEGFETEEFLHGPLSEMDSRAALVAFLTGGPADDRARQVLAAVGELGVARVAVCVAGKPSTSATSSSGALAAPAGSSSGPLAGHSLGALTERVIEVPAVPEWLSPFPQTVAAQLLSYFLALERGTNPDWGREDQPDHARSRQHFKL